jgi:archaetidylinositol phosphate synthase
MVVLVSSRLKQIFEKWAATRVEALVSVGLTPNKVTILGLASSLFAAWFYSEWRLNRLMLPAAAVLVLLSGLLDGLDGVLARATGRTSTFGGFLDSVVDRYSDAVVIAAVTVSGLCLPISGLTALIGSMMVSYSRARAEAAGVVMAAVGIAERAERMLILAIATFAAYFNIDMLSWGITILALLSHFTVLQRSAHAFREMKKR